MGVFVESIVITTSQRRLRVPRKRIEQLVNFIARSAGRRVEYVEIDIVGQRRMATLNESMVGHVGPTDVISLDLGAMDENGLCAQLVVCSDVAIAQARRRGHSAQKELLLYIAHGLLHMVGYDDIKAADAKRMHARENELLEAFGIGRVYGE